LPVYEFTAVLWTLMFSVCICEFHQTAVMTLTIGVLVEEKTTEPASDYDANINSSLSKSQIEKNEHDVLE
jgi:hypothetical protein